METNEKKKQLPEVKLVASRENSGKEKSGKAEERWGSFAVFCHNSFSTILLTIHTCMCVFSQKLKFHLKSSVLLLRKQKQKGKHRISRTPT